jgi:hypothetical protein
MDCMGTAFVERPWAALRCMLRSPPPVHPPPHPSPPPNPTHPTLHSCPPLSVTQELYAQLKALAELNRDELLRHRKLVSDFTEASSADLSTPCFSGITEAASGSGPGPAPPGVGAPASVTPAPDAMDRPYRLLVEAGYHRRDSVSTYTVSSSSSSSRCVCARVCVCGRGRWSKLARQHAHGVSRHPMQ